MINHDLGKRSVSVFAQVIPTQKNLLITFLSLLAFKNWDIFFGSLDCVRSLVWPFGSVELPIIGRV